MGFIFIVYSECKLLETLICFGVADRIVEFLFEQVFEEQQLMFWNQIDSAFDGD